MLKTTQINMIRLKTSVQKFLHNKLVVLPIIKTNYTNLLHKLSFFTDFKNKTLKTILNYIGYAFFLLLLKISDSMKQKLLYFFGLPLFNNQKYISGIWYLLALVSSLKQYFSCNPDKYNNYLIYKNVFFHTLHKLNLYDAYPLEYFDHNHYGPIFSVVIAPFAVLPDIVGMTLWSLFNTFVLLYAIKKLPVNPAQINAILWICAHEFLTTILSFQFNPIMGAIIIFSFVFIITRKDILAAMAIVLGVFVKIYGIVGLAFFFFSKQKVKFILWLLIWSALLFAIPMLFSSPQFIVQTYRDWFERLVVKNSENASLLSMQDISFMGIFRRVLQNPNLSNIPFLLFGIICFGLPYLRISYYKNPKFQLLLLSSVLIFTVIFSSGSESPTYIIAFLGVAIWFVIKEKKVSNWDIFLLVFALILTSFSPSDLIPKFLREQYIKPYALKALPCVLIWFQIVFEMMTLKSSTAEKITLQ